MEMLCHTYSNSKNKSLTLVGISKDVAESRSSWLWEVGCPGITATSDSTLECMPRRSPCLWMLGQCSLTAVCVEEHPRSLERELWSQRIWAGPLMCFCLSNRFLGEV